MAMESIYKVPEFRYQQRVEHTAEQKQERRQSGNGQKRKKKKENDQATALFENLADSLGQYSHDEPFQLHG